MAISVFRFLESIGGRPEDSPELRTQKRVLVVVSAVVAFLAIFWSALYLAYGERVAALIPFIYSVTATASLTIFARTYRYKFFRFSQLALIALLPFLLQLALGGFVNGSIVILWALLAPIGALAVSGRTHALRWMIVYAVLVAAAQLIQPSLAIDNRLPDEVIAAFFVLNLIAPAGVVFFAMHYFVGQKDAVLEQLDIESAKSERLLLNVLPRDIADELKETGHTKAQYFPSVTVLFADIVGFTTMSEKMEPGDMVSLLNGAFTYFDSLTARYGLEKIRTMGDSYMVASGVPAKRDDHARAMADMALEMLTSPLTHAGPLEFRIGMSSGPAVAGVIGTSKFQYDVWGDTVNTASRMESQGIPGRIQISPSAFRLLESDYVCEPRGELDIKGKGAMQTWFLVGPK